MTAGAGRPRRPAMRLAWLSAAALMCAGFLALGCWQLQRLAWKLDLIERVEQRVHATPVPAPGPERWLLMSAASDEYLRLTAAGLWLHSLSTRVQASTELGSGFWLLTPLCQADGSIILINRGFVPSRPDDWKAVAPQLANGDACVPRAGRVPGEVSVTGLLRISEPGGSALRRNDADASHWYSRDVAAISAAHRLRRTAPYFIDAEADASAAPASVEAADDLHPVGGLTVISFRNNHLVYALTWFALALMAAGACWLMTRDKWKRKDGETT